MPGTNAKQQRVIQDQSKAATASQMLYLQPAIGKGIARRSWTQHHGNMLLEKREMETMFPELVAYRG